ncbi:hypothetical protein ACFQ36_12005 [Arthrobacter sp. GCM10027362]|uniref:hypothetical protein n=1 Tax=Arthrobacter sp. GCM10027362 TaxID=3273379 RepID=UPI003640D61E
MPASPAPQTITASTADEANTLLNIVVEEFQHLARQDPGCGILVTKTGPGQFTVELSEHVPYGLTLQAVV